ncbi:MAG: tRNA lysidine(34) synthetase TilS [Deltaproteobacteria bacterium]|nr:tRNA lysidine(34) synthetase TilS [Deltaproteobacteria bacterium]
MLEKVRRTIAAHGLFEPNDCVLVACSGGPDSVALLAGLSELGRELCIELCVAHVDHGLRPGSERDGELVGRIAARLDLGLRIERIEVPAGPGGVLERAREARYACLEKVADELGCARIAVGHTRGDQAETVLHRLLRGTGIEGLGAIPPRRGRIVRPLLDVGRPEVLEFLRTRGLPWVEDPSNERLEFLRVRLRREVLPLLDDLAPGVEERLAALAAEARGLTEELQRLVEPFAQPSVLTIARAPEGLRPLVVREVLRRLRGDLRELTRAHLEAAARLALDGPRRGEVHLPRGALVRDDDALGWVPGGGHGQVKDSTKAGTKSFG